MMRIGALVSDFLPTPVLPCHSPHAGGIIWASLCFKNTSNQSEEVIGSRMEGHVTRHRFHASLRDCYYIPENWDTLCCSRVL